MTGFSGFSQEILVMPITKEYPTEGAEIQNRIREESLAYFQAETQKPLVTELWAIRGRTNEVRVKQIASRSRLPLVWSDKMPGMNGDTGTEKLRAERSVLLLRDRMSPFIEQFKHPIGRCARFYKLTAYNNCNFWCEYCYLYLTFRTQPVSTHFINYEKMYEEIERFDRSRIPKSLRVLNLGELGDPLAVDYITGFAKQIIPFMPERAPHTRLLFLTKSDCVDEILGLDHSGQSIISFSVNTDTVFQQLEHRTASPESRLAAAAKVQKAGYEVRLRIDPVIFYSTWQKDYKALVDKIFQFVQPTRITIGEYRPSNGLANHISSRFPDSPLLRINKHLVREGRKLRYPKAQRITMFRTIIEAIRKRGPDVHIALCKEQPQIWRAVGLDAKGLLCNCVA
jgi:spore photoproduct lyase